MLKKIIFIASFLAFSQGILSAQESMSLKQAVDFAVENNFQISAAKKTFESSRYEANASIGTFLPRIDLTGGAFKMYGSALLDPKNMRNYLNDIQKLNQALLNGLINPLQYSYMLAQNFPSFEDKAQTSVITRGAVSAVQPIFTGFKLTASAKAAGLMEDAAKINLELTKDSTIAMVIKDYFKAKLAQQAAEIRLDYKKDIQEHVSKSNALFKSGLISKSNHLRAEVALAQADRDYQNSLTDEAMALTILENDLNKSLENIVLSEPMEMAKNLKPINYYLSQADINNPSLKLLEIQKKILKQKYLAAIGNLLPNIAAVGEYQLLKDDLTIIEPEWSVGITATMNIFSGASDYNRIKAAKSQVEAVDEQIKSTRNLINTAVKNYYRQCQAAKRDYEAISSDSQLAKENLKLSTTAFKTGAATYLEVLDAELSLIKIQLDKAKSVSDYNSAYADLLNLCGQTIEFFKD